jgi:acetyl esterase/lipase
MKHDIIYVPGLGDKKLRGQRLLISTWRFLGVRPIMVPMNWSDGDSFAPKLERLLDKIDDLQGNGHRISLVGASAGAGAVINAFAARKDVIDGVVIICGKVNTPEAIGHRYSGPNPAFLESAFMVQKSLDQLDFDTDRKRIQSRYAFIDPAIPMGDSKVTGGINRMMPTIGHGFTIATQLLFGAPSFLFWLKNLGK